MNKVTVRDVDLKGKRIIVRVDYNVPFNEKGKISDDARIRASLPTIQYILEQGAAKVILMSHLGRPKGVDESLRLKPIAKKLQKLLGEKVQALPDCVGDSVRRTIGRTKKRVILLENLRFHSEEEAGDENFSKELASFADIYVNDAFGTAHRAHASTTIIAKFIPTACIGFLIEKEINYLSKVAFNPEKPFVAVLGGAKVSDKIGIIEQLLAKVDVFLIGGAMAYTFLKAQGISVGASRVEEDKIELAKKILSEAFAKGVKIILPLDHLVVDDLEKPETKKIVSDIPAGTKGIDIGPKTIRAFKRALKTAKTVLLNGPVGIFENPAYAKGTKDIVKFLAKIQATVVVGGGDSAAAAKKFKVLDKVSHVSTGGGASLEFLEGKELPGIAIIPNKAQ